MRTATRSNKLIPFPLATNEASRYACATNEPNSPNESRHSEGPTSSCGSTISVMTSYSKRRQRTTTLHLQGGAKCCQPLVTGPDPATPGPTPNGPNAAQDPTNTGRASRDATSPPPAHLVWATAQRRGRASAWQLVIVIDHFTNVLAHVGLVTKCGSGDDITIDAQCSM